MPIDEGHRSSDGSCCETLQCTVDKIARVAYDAANEAHRNGRLLSEINAALTKLVEMYEGSHPEQALELRRLEQLEDKIRHCCPPEEPDDAVYTYVPCEPGGGIPGAGTGWSVKATAYVEPERVSAEHPKWTIKPHRMHEADETLPAVERGPFVGHIVPSAQTAAPMDFRSGSGPVPGGQQPVTFRTFTNGSETQGLWPPDMSGAKSGDVVLMSGNLWLKLSVDGGKKFADLDFTKVFAKAPKDYGDWKGDQVIIYVPEIDCFVLYVQSGKGTGSTRNKSVVKIAIASPSDLNKYKGGAAAWTRQWNFTSDTFGINAWLDFPDLSFGAGYLYVNTNTFAGTAATIAAGTPDLFTGKLFWELPLSDMKVGGSLSFRFGYLTDALSYGSPTQNIGDENYWAAHNGNGTLRIYSSKGTDENYFWRERSLLANYPVSPKDSAGIPDIVSKPPDVSDWISLDDRIIGSTKVGNQLWFAWTAAPGSANTDGSGFNFPQAHIQIAKVDLNQDYKVVDQMQVWNANYAFAYPSLVTNSNNEVGISCAWGGGGNYGSHVVGIIGDFVLWFGEASDRTSTAVSPTRFGDYLHVRLAHPDTRFFSGFGYAVHNTTPAGESANYLYVEFGREAIPSSGLH